MTSTERESLKELYGMFDLFWNGNTSLGIGYPKVYEEVKEIAKRAWETALRLR